MHRQQTRSFDIHFSSTLQRKQPGGDDAAGGQPGGNASSVPASKDGSDSNGGSSAPAADSGEAAAKGYKLKSLKKDAVRKPAEWTDLKVGTSLRSQCFSVSVTFCECHEDDLNSQWCWASV